MFGARCDIGMVNYSTRLLPECRAYNFLRKNQMVIGDKLKALDAATILPS